MSLFRFACVLCGVSLLAGCATQSPESFPRLRELPVPNAAASQPTQPATPLVEYATSPYRSWTPSPQREARLRQRLQVQYVETDWQTLKKAGQQDVVACIQDTRQQLTQQGNGQWTYVAGKGYTRKTVALPQSPACWSNLSTAFQQNWSSAETQVGRDNPLTRYDSALSHWANFCGQTAITSKGLQNCLASSWIPVIQSRKAAVRQYVRDAESTGGPNTVVAGGEPLIEVVR